jgi:hypothetical protein
MSSRQTKRRTAARRCLRALETLRSDALMFVDSPAPDFALELPMRSLIEAAAELHNFLNLTEACLYPNLPTDSPHDKKGGPQ